MVGTLRNEINDDRHFRADRDRDRRAKRRDPLVKRGSVHEGPAPAQVGGRTRSKDQCAPLAQHAAFHHRPRVPDEEMHAAAITALMIMPIAPFTAAPSVKT